MPDHARGQHGWPRHLTRDLAAEYVGVSVDVFDDEVRSGLWPAPRRRGAKGGRHTWDRLALDRASDAGCAIQAGDAAPLAAAAPDIDMALAEAMRGAAKGRRDQDRPQAQGGRHGHGVPLRQASA